MASGLGMQSGLCLFLLLVCWPCPRTGAFYLLRRHYERHHDSEVYYHVTPVPAPAPAQDPPPQSSTPDLPPVGCHGAGFADRLEAECGFRPHTHHNGSHHSYSHPSGACERDVTTRALQESILYKKDFQCVAEILIQTGSVGGIEAGFRIDPASNFQPYCGFRETDPDVVALKGIALGVLVGVWEDDQLLQKIVDGVVPSLTPPGEHSGNWAETDENRQRQKMVDRDAFFDKLNNVDYLTSTLFDDPNNSAPCNGQQVNTPASSRHQSSSRRRMLDESIVGSSARRLQCSDCDNADSYPCAYCWHEDVCSDMYWCQDP